MSIRTDYLGDSSTNNTLAEGQGSATSEAGEAKSIWRRTIAAYMAASEDERLDDLAVRLFMWLLERTFDFKEGGDGDGGIIADVKKIASKIKRPANRRKSFRIPKRAKGKCVGVTKRQRENGPAHPTRKAVSHSLNLLERASYIWRERLRAAGWPTKKIFIGSILPKSIQKDLFANSPERTLESSSERTHMSSSERPTVQCTGSQDVQGGGKPPAPEATTGKIKELSAPLARSVFAQKFPDPDFEELDWGMYASKRKSWAADAIALAESQSESIKADPLAKEEGRLSVEALSRCKQFRARIASVKAWATGQKAWR